MLCSFLEPRHCILGVRAPLYQRAWIHHIADLVGQEVLHRHKIKHLVYFPRNIVRVHSWSYYMHETSAKRPVKRFFSRPVQAGVLLLRLLWVDAIRIRDMQHAATDSETWRLRYWCITAANSSSLWWMKPWSYLRCLGGQDVLLGPNTSSFWALQMCHHGPGFYSTRASNMCPLQLPCVFLCGSQSSWTTALWRVLSSWSPYHSANKWKRIVSCCPTLLVLF